jgi:enoyl-CoA hydratase/carnithine racemase
MRWRGSPLIVELVGEKTAVLRLNRPAKRNAINDELISALIDFFVDPPDDTRAVVITGEGEHFSAGLDLSEHQERDAVEAMTHSQLWHGCFHAIQFGKVPVVSAMQGAVIGGGLELAAATHVRVAELGCFYGLPEGQRGIFVGGGASVRVARLIGADRMAEMMLTGRVYDAEEGQRLGLSHYLVEAGKGLDRALELAERMTGNARLTNYAILQALPRIQEMSMDSGLFAESLMSAIVQTGPEAQAGMAAFLERSGARKVKDDKDG